MLYDGKSCGEAGTLYQIRNKFGHRQVQKKVMECYNHMVDFLKFTTTGLVCVLAMKLLNIKKQEDIPESFREKEGAKGWYYLHCIFKLIKYLLYAYLFDTVSKLCYSDHWIVPANSYLKICFT